MKSAKEILKDKFKNAQTNDDSHVMDRMLDVTYGLATKVPVFGKYAKDALDKTNALENAKKITSKVFKPFFPSPKVDKKHTEKFVKGKEETAE